MRLTLIINSIVCFFGAIGGAFFMMASIISIANMQVPWVSVLLGAAFLVPVMFVISGVGGWVAHRWDSKRFVVVLLALPWIYLTLFVASMLLSFKS